MLVLLSAGTIATFDDYLVRLRWKTLVITGCRCLLPAISVIRI